MIGLKFLGSLLPNTDLPNVEAGSTQLQDILSVVFGLAGIIAFFIVVIAGFQLVISSGDPQKISKARQTILFAVVGLVVCSAAFTIVRFVVGRAR